MSCKTTPAIIAMCLGDAHIDKHCRLTMKHCEKQKEYFEYKLKILQTLQKQEVWNNIYYNYNPKYNKTYLTYQLATKQKPIYRIVKEWMSKGITRKLLEKLDEHAIAIWFMDDGSTTVLKSPNGKIRATITTLATYTTKEQNQVIVDFFLEKYGIKWRVHKQGELYRIQIGTKEAKKLGVLLEPYILPCLRYKIEPLLIQDRTSLADENIV